LSVLLAAVVALATLFVLLHVLVYFAQERMIFFPQPLTGEMRAALHKAVPDAEEIELPTADGQRLHGWFLPNGAPAQGAPALIYFGGNAEAVSLLALDAHDLRGISLFLFDYRGYGASTGEPGERAFFADALAIYDHVASLPRVDRKRIFVMGRSLGSGVATYLASERPVSRVVLVTPFDSMAAVAHTHYPYLLTGMLLRHRFDSASRAAAIDAPLLALIAGADNIVPARHGLALAKAWHGPVKSVVLPGAGHNDIQGHPAYWPAIREFLGKTAADAASRT
jgi:fermentation-respiration switch protein FrsA (DUF1100 family)